ncbi:unnamed protein product [Darwinula stevensoni]|uniref:Uncharacterized protein n=1 Tax=Darwinula stevensoni TaxID=69355 RepID=A0A7R8XA59_9CRUS|nr:unnamed protein product [Darwinula stevensoni]CAG0885237.1 unnamed protein product [Darwinula stevensoni]
MGEHVWHGVPHPDQYAECEKFILVNSSDSREGRCTYDNSSTEECHEWIFEDTIYESTIVTQFELVCERRSLQPLSRSLYMAGHLVGALIMGWVSDK